MRARESMPPPTLTRPHTVTHTHRGGKGREPPSHDDDDSRKGRSRVRRRARSRSLSESERSRTSSEATRTPRSARVNHSTPDSRRSSRSYSSRRPSSVDSASSISTQSEVKEILRREPADIEVLPDREKVSHRRHRRRHRGKEAVVYEEPDVYEDEITQTYKHVAPGAMSKGAHRRSHRHHSESRSPSRRRHRHHDNRDEVKTSSRSKRGTKKYYKSDSAPLERPKLPRSSSSNITSSHSVSASSRRSSSTFISNFFGSSVHPARPVKYVECVACLDDEVPSNKTAKLKCEHRMCHSCMKRIFKVSIKDPQMMPPKCCTEQPIPVKHVERLFDTNFKKTWNQKFHEYSTRNRIYCPSRRCGEWIKPDRIQKFKDGRKYAKCGQCKTEVCCVCNGKWHRSKDCPRDEATNEILEQAKEYGWQRCYNCKTMVELKEGCNHMTCRCGSEFCMICGSKWKSCECPWFNYDAVEQDRLEHITVHEERDRSSPRESRGHSTRHRAQTYEEEILMRREQERRDEDFARRLQYDDTDDDYIDSYGKLVGIGNSAGHFMNDDYRRTPRVVPPAPSPPLAAVDRANTGDYVTGVNRARGVRASSMERRLADRFSEQRHGTSPTQRSYTHPMPPPPPPPLGLGMSPPLPTQPPPGMPFVRRHTMEEDLYGGPSHVRMAERMTPGRARLDYEAEAAIHAPISRRRPREPMHEPPRDSVLAGLSGPRTGMNRVFEWRNHVAPGEPDNAHGIAAR
ncbi:hypothetical protein JX265_000267 [Neoarthrinium moseri]|uniref:RBR-type E3 ubiquitin transferase n=1 Tax=Neoarthrinium moseri TaxID=1658444 RepID=A0A9P9WY81_9PEZI|nr:hypothetical protein JX265_000267 [Neoarthrinium moseri]